MTVVVVEDDVVNEAESLGITHEWFTSNGFPIIVRLNYSSTWSKFRIL